MSIISNRYNAEALKIIACKVYNLKYFGLKCTTYGIAMYANPLIIFFSFSVGALC